MFRFKRRIEEPFFLAPDEAGGGVAPVAPVAAPTAAPDAQTATTGGTQDPGALTEVKPDAQPTPTETKPLDPARLQRENARMAKALQTLQAHNAELQKLAESGKKTATPTPKADHPALQGLETDENGDVLFDGHYVSPEFAIRQAERDQEVSDLRNRLAERDRAEAEGKVNQARDGFMSEVKSVVSELRGEMFPNLDKDNAAAVDQNIQAQVQMALYDALGRGEDLTPELAQKCIGDALESSYRLFGLFGAKQIEENQKHAETYPVKPDGTPGVPADVSYFGMTKEQRETAASQAAARAMARRAGG